VNAVKLFLHYIFLKGNWGWPPPGYAPEQRCCEEVGGGDGDRKTGDKWFENKRSWQLVSSFFRWVGVILCQFMQLTPVA